MSGSAERATPGAVLDDDTGAYMPAQQAAKPRPGLVWLRSRNGVEHHVAVGSEAHIRLVAGEATPIDGPSAS
jgi:hypothetical protein